MYRFHTRNRAKLWSSVASCDVFHYSLRHISFQFKRGWRAKGEWISHRIMMNSELSISMNFSKYCLPDIKYFYNPVNIMEIRLQDAANGTKGKDVVLSRFPQMRHKKRTVKP